jgi:hypothetical protein
LFVVLYEEPTLRKKFGADYEDYCGNVRRWWPRPRAWDKANSAAGIHQHPITVANVGDPETRLAGD